jgi:hypothetical protein
LCPLCVFLFVFFVVKMYLYSFNIQQSTTIINQSPPLPSPLVEKGWG